MATPTLLAQPSILGFETWTQLLQEAQPLGATPPGRWVSPTRKVHRPAENDHAATGGAEQTPYLLESGARFAGPDLPWPPLPPLHSRGRAGTALGAGAGGPRRLWPRLLAADELILHPLE